MKKCRVSPIRVVASRVSPTMEPEGCPRKSSTSSPPAPRSSTPELQSLADQASLPGIHKPLQGRYLGEDTDDEGDVRRPTDGLSHRKVSLASSQPRSPPAKEPAAVKTVASPSTLSRRKRKRASIRKLLRSPSAAPSTPAVMSMNADAAASVSVANRAAIEAGPATHQLARVRTPDHADTSTVPTKASAGLARHQGMEELQAVDQNRQRRTPLRETTNTLGHMSPGCVSGYLRLRTPSPSCPGTPPSTAGGVKGDLRRLMGSLDLTSERPPPATPNWHDHVSPAPLTSSPEMTECPFALPPDVGSGFVVSYKTLQRQQHT
ncbi:uncharacterized protein LOC142769209 [Rhipicephalus microplus]|uniref:uncharacterized protein LOC142769209 n=1 Tax=Rhipicephalus microplus TaxID=6941 RepID=UPI003F6B2FDB